MEESKGQIDFYYGQGPYLLKKMPLKGDPRNFLCFARPKYLGDHPRTDVSDWDVLFGALQTGFSNRKVLESSYEASVVSGSRVPRGGHWQESERR